MIASYPFCSAINLHVEHRISVEDAKRQERTARELLRRLSSQPGVILADEVGMGKTFVALAAAVSVALNDPQHRPVVVMVPPSLKHKWPTDFKLFRQKCLPADVAAKVSSAQVDGAVAFLKLLDNTSHKRPTVIFLTHGAFSRQLVDSWVMLAFIRQSLHRRRNSADLRRLLPRILPQLLYMKWVGKPDAPIWTELLETTPNSWLRVLKRYGVDPEHDRDATTDDDPVPEAIAGFLNGLTAADTQGIFDALNDIPLRKSQNWDRRVKDAARTITAEIRGLWPRCVQELRIQLPLLVLDEAHHLKNPGTQLAGMFRNEESREDVEEISRGAFGGVFERMLLLTATPFQLGHAELCSVLSTFGGTNWSANNAPSGGRAKFDLQMTKLRADLDAAQQAAVTLDTAWGRLRPEDLVVSGELMPDADLWWSKAQHSEELSDTARDVMRCYQLTRKRMGEAGKLLRPWVVRHLRSKHLPGEFGDRLRRDRLVGRAICDPSCGTDIGITVTEKSLLPFLLAARATACAPESRPVFAEGLASSYEAFLHTRKTNLGKSSVCVGLDADEEGDVYDQDCDDSMTWYLDRLEELVPKGNAAASAAHPKISATVERVVDLWRSGEKVLVFCHYVATGRALRQRISDAIDAEITKLGAEKLGCSPDQVDRELESLGLRFFDSDSRVRQGCDRACNELIDQWRQLAPYRQDLVDVMRRFMRTPSFLTRFFDISDRALNEGSVQAALDTTDTSGITLRGLFGGFLEFLAVRCGEEERVRYVDAVSRVQTGSHVGKDAAADEASGPDATQTPRQLPNVRLVNGSTIQETRSRYMLAFNTPFYPEVLVASSVLAEGVDLHLSCRHVIHHDLCWNPSTLEQRTGRVDRIGAKAERCGHPIRVYLPFIAETQDEKMYRVVMDRERWFGVVMGEKYQVDARSTEKLAKRVPFPEAAANELAFKLGV
ncbi:MAG: helicase-related protein [Armatimonadia bacterium]